MRRLAPTLFMSLVLATPLAAQQSHPDFSGDWSFDAAHSQMPMGAPTSMTMHVNQDGKAMTVKRSFESEMGKQDMSMKLALDTTTSKNSMTAQGMSLEMNSKTAWAGDTLVVSTSSEVQGQTISQVDRWTLSADKKSLLIDTSANVAGQSMSYKLAFAKK